MILPTLNRLTWSIGYVPLTGQSEVASVPLTRPEGLGRAAVCAGMRVRFFAASDIVEMPYRGLAANSVGKVIDGLLRVDLVLLDELGFASLDLTGTQLLYRFIYVGYERRALGIASHWPFDQWGWFFPEPTTATSMIALIDFCRPSTPAAAQPEPAVGHDARDRRLGR